MAITIPTPQSLLMKIPLYQAYQQNKTAQSNLATQEAYAKAQDQRIAMLKQTGQYPIATQGTPAQKVYYNPQTKQYQNTPVGSPTPPASPLPQVPAPRGSNVGGGSGVIQQSNTVLEESIPGVRDMTFNWANETRAAYDSLKDFYAKLMEFAQGDVDLAKRVLQYTYEQGMRESKQVFEEDTQEQARVFPKETESLIGSLNRRGVFFSGFGKKDREDLRGNQDLRALQVQRALENQTSKLGFSRDTGMQEQEQKLAKTKFDLERERRRESEGMAKDKYAIKSDIYGTELDKATQAENRRVQQIANTATSGLGTNPTGPVVKSGGATGKVADNTGRLYGGWYDNPVTGKNQRYWGNNVWTDN